jgi:hypothetical protein
LEVYEDTQSATDAAEVCYPYHPPSSQPSNFTFSKASPPFCDEEAGMMMTAVYQFLPTIDQFLHAMIEKRSEFAKIPVQNILEYLKYDLEAMKDVTTKFDGALKQKFPVGFLYFFLFLTMAVP